MSNVDIFAETSYRGEMIELFAKLLWPGLLEKFSQILDDSRYNLAEQLQQAIQTQKALRILEPGAGEGVYLYRLAGLLEERGLIDPKWITLTGLDPNKLAVQTATDFCQLAKPARPYLDFYVQAKGRRLAQNPDLRLAGRREFTFIFAILHLTSTPAARNELADLYQHLTPGGVLYIRDYSNKRGSDGWEPAHPAVEKFSELSARFVASLNNGGDVAVEIPGWLAEMGAINITTNQVILPYGGETKLGLDMLRFLIHYIRYMGPVLVQNNLMSAVEYDNMLQTIYRELSPASRGQIAHVDIVAAKPR